MAFATVTSKGQTTIPKAVRDSLGLKAGDKVRFTLLSDGTVIMRAKKRSIRDLFGTLRDPDRPPIPIEEMNPWR
ncbi:MAG TPA: type II toxin-antitoxin system PrlF family antitoxin [Caulobacteraceae bacterium]|jgi:AbrB family looped-hinge helix DNA binding protein|nr:type II toxin-antitoxin system PrlF family antitoxin [Caulobacteraceae bacterium]